MQYKTTTAQETLDIGVQIAATLRGGDVVLLTGDLGAGKTTLTKGMLSHFGIDANSVVSPTFSLMQVYEIRDMKYEVGRIVHVDTYRMESEEELLEIGIEEYLGDEKTIVIVEWPEKIATLLQNKKVVTVSLDHSGEDTREIVVTA